MSYIYSLLPVLLFLLLLLYLDSFKLIKWGLLIISALWGVSSSISTYGLNTYLLSAFHISSNDYSIFIAPVVEEGLKLLFILVLFYTSRLGFMIDAAIYGFSAGLGFALFENSFYAYSMEVISSGVWIVRGLGTAIMHGGTTSVFAISLMAFSNEKARINCWQFFISFIVIVLIHSLYNSFIISPLISALVVFVFMGVLHYLVFVLSESRIRNWLDMEFDSEVSLLSSIRQGKLLESRAGAFVKEATTKFEPLIIVDMLAYLSLYLELSIKAKSRLLLKESGLALPSMHKERAQFSELKQLEKNIGKTGKLALSPVLRNSKRDIWKWLQLK